MRKKCEGCDGDKRMLFRTEILEKRELYINKQKSITKKVRIIKHLCKKCRKDMKNEKQM
jgi:hypothetical protein